MGGLTGVNVCAFHNGDFSEESVLFDDSQLTYRLMMPIFECLWAISSMDLVWKFECDPSSGSQVIMHTNTKKTKTDTAKMNRCGKF